MNRCQYRSGFLIQRDCKNEGAGKCGTCHRRMCKKHAVASSDGARPICVECYGKSGDWTDTYDDYWLYSYRHHHYRSGYSPVYWGHHHHHYYDDYDVRSFDSDGDVGAAGMNEIEDDGDFLDS